MGNYRTEKSIVIKTDHDSLLVEFDLKKSQKIIETIETSDNSLFLTSA